MAKRLWLLFAQFVTLCLAIIFVISTLKPNWLGQLQFSNQIKSINDTQNWAKKIFETDFWLISFIINALQKN